MINKKIVKSLLLIMSFVTVFSFIGCKKNKQENTEDLSNINKILQDEMKNAEDAVNSNHTEGETPSTSAIDAQFENTESTTVANLTEQNNNKEKISENQLLLLPVDDTTNILATAFIDSGYISINKDNIIYGGTYEFSKKTANPVYTISMNEYKLTEEGINSFKSVLTQSNIDNLTEKLSDEESYCKYSCDNIQYDDNGKITTLDLQKRSLYITKNYQGKYTDKYGSPITYRVVDSDTFSKTLSNYYSN